jgi:hypothetical protein
MPPTFCHWSTERVIWAPVGWDLAAWLADRPRLMLLASACGVAVEPSRICGTRRLHEGGGSRLRFGYDVARPHGRRY